MATRQMTVSLSLVVKTTDEWAAVSTVIKAGMPVVEKTDVGYMMKVGDGVNTFADLPYVGGPVTDLTKEMIIDTLEYTPLDAAKAGVAGGVATLDENGYIPSTQIPDAVDEIIEIITIDDAPAEGKAGKIYVAIDTGICYRWSGTTYTEISKSITITASENNGYIKVNGVDVKVFEITVDAAIDKESENPVQNKAVATALESKVDVTDTLELNCSL